MTRALLVFAAAAALCFQSSRAAAQTVAVCTGAYELPLEGKLSAERAAMVAQRLASGAPQTAQAKIAVANCRCSEPKCLAAFVTQDQPIALAATVRDMAGEYQVVVYDDAGAARTATVEGPFDDLLTKLDELATALLTARLAPLAPPEPVTEPLTEPVAPEVEDSAERRRLGPTAFWIAAGSTVALGIAYGVTEALLISRGSSLESQVPSERAPAEWDSLHSLQVADRVVFATMLTAAVTTAVLALFTEFRKKPTAQEKTALRVRGLGVQGSF